MLDLNRLACPVLFRGDLERAFRDPAAVYHDGALHLFFTLSENDEDGGYHNRLAHSVSGDLVHWSEPRVLTPRDRALNFSSPGNVIRHEGRWVLCVQTYPTPQRELYGTADSRVFAMRSDDLVRWDEPELLRVKGPGVPGEAMGRMIDPYLLADAREPGTWWCYYKQDGVSISRSRDLRTWQYVGRADAGENVSVVRQGDEYVMFHSPENGIGVKRSRDPACWGPDVQHLALGQDRWPWAAARLTAATVLDLAAEPATARYLMFFHGDDVEGARRQPAHGAASLGVAWSEDLVHWDWPGRT